MIKAKFVAGLVAEGTIFYPVRDFEGELTEKISVPLDLTFPFQQGRAEGFEKLEQRIIKAVEEMVDKLNEKEDSVENEIEKSFRKSFQEMS